MRRRGKRENLPAQDSLHNLSEAKATSRTQARLSSEEKKLFVACSNNSITFRDSNRGRRKHEEISARKKFSNQLSMFMTASRCSEGGGKVLLEYFSRTWDNRKCTWKRKCKVDTRSSAPGSVVYLYGANCCSRCRFSAASANPMFTGFLLAALGIDWTFFCA